MKKQRVTLLGVLVVAFVLMVGLPGLFAEDSDGSMYGYISYVDGTATVLREDKTENQAVVNLPVVPGDQILTAEKGRVEVQFDNGTVVRLDRDSRLKITTVLAPSLTTKWKITTLHLMRGALCSINQKYNREMFQVITPNAAVEMKDRTTAYINVKENGDTLLFAERGKFDVMYGESVNDLKTEEIKGDNGFLVTTDHKFIADDGKRDLDFVSWNEYVNRNFKDLHYGVAKVPKKIYRYNKGLVYWAEKWSTLYGEWIYDDIFGYVWKPADELFSFSHRPFFHANYVRVNGQLFIVPQQAWGWAPAHMGTWVWDTKRGWTWIPGNTFTPGFYNDPFWRFSAEYSGFCCYPTLEYWIMRAYGGYDLYYTYRIAGMRAWRDTYQKRYNTYKKSPVSDDVPKPVREIIAKLDKVPVETVKARMGAEMKKPVIEMDKIRPLFKGATPVDNTERKAVSPSIRVKSGGIATSNVIARDATIVREEAEKDNLLNARLKSGGNGPRLRAENFRDFNPDTQWAIQKGYEIIYSSRNNDIVCPNLGLTAQTITRAQRAALIERNSLWSNGRGGAGTSGTGTSTGATGTANVTTPGSGTRVSGSGQTSGPGGGHAKDK